MIEIEKIEKRYKDNLALNEVSLTIKKGELFGLIGPDGAGKTSLIRILATLLLPDKGNAYMSAFNVVKDYRSVRKIVGYMPGRFSLYQDLTVRENLDFFAMVFGTTVKENYNLVEDIYKQIKPFETRQAGKLSGGMKQKLALSCALIHRPDILLLDEPTTGVDAVSRKEFWEMLKNLQNKGITILVSTPYMDEATLCNRVALMSQGEILQVGNKDEIVGSFSSQLFAVKSENTFQLITDLRKYVGTASAYAFGESIHFKPNSNFISPNELNAYLKNKGHVDVKIQPISPGIEDVFMDLLQTS